jgi:hypothetical protein|tara:strand:+ start:478 stop:657 length:180 start_codon:yes stop_codon:yes gene_type:complete
MVHLYECLVIEPNVGQQNGDFLHELLGFGALNIGLPCSLVCCFHALQRWPQRSLPRCGQ